MESTIFAYLAPIYRLHMPNSRSIPTKIWPHAESLALTFYATLFRDKIKGSFAGTLLAKYIIPHQTVRESYMKFFYSLNNKCQRVLDFFACIICLLSDVIFTPSQAVNDQISKFLEEIEVRGENFNEYLYIYYTYETLGVQVSTKSGFLLFQKFIISKNQQTQTAVSEARLNRQLKSVKKSLERESINITTRRKKFLKKRVSGFSDEIEKIFNCNLEELENEQKNERKLKKLMSRCFTEGLSSINPSILENNIKDINISDILHALQSSQNSNKNLYLRKPKQSMRKENTNNYSFWKKIVLEMKSFCSSSNSMLLNESFGSPPPCCSQTTPISLRKSRDSKDMRNVSEDVRLKRGKKDKTNRIGGIKYECMLPKIKKKSKAEDDLKKVLDSKLSSKKYREEYHKFLNDRRKKKML